MGRFVFRFIFDFLYVGIWVCVYRVGIRLGVVVCVGRLGWVCVEWVAGEDSFVSCIRVSEGGLWFFFFVSFLVGKVRNGFCTRDYVGVGGVFINDR